MARTRKRRKKCRCPRGFESHGKTYCFNRRTGAYKRRKFTCGTKRRRACKIRVRGYTRRCTRRRKRGWFG